MINRVSLFLLLPVMVTSALAQDIVEDELQPEVRRYTVEMVIFSYAQDVSVGSEIFVPDVPPAIELPLQELLMEDSLVRDAAEPQEITQDAEEDADKYELVMLPAEDFSLLDVVEHLDTLDAYTPLAHFGWTQPTYPEEDTQARPLSSFITPPDGLQGELMLYLSRYLHLAVSMQLDAPVAEEPEVIPLPGDIYYDYAAFDAAPVVTYPVRYRIDEDRIFRNGDLRYYDHPKFGVLAKITRVEEEEPTEEELLGETELLGE